MADIRLNDVDALEMSLKGSKIPSGDYSDKMRTRTSKPIKAAAMARPLSKPLIAGEGIATGLGAAAGRLAGAEVGAGRGVGGAGAAACTGAAAV
jgi:hypothetical protein